MIRPPGDVATTGGGLLGHIKRRQLLRLGFLGGTLLALTELSALIYPFMKPNKIVGLGAKIPVGSKEALLALRPDFVLADGEYHFNGKDGTATYDPPLPNMPKESKTSVDAKWVGPCKAGQQPGDMTLETGQTVNIKQMMQPGPSGTVQPMPKK